MNIKIFSRCSLFPSWLGYGLISTPVKHGVTEESNVPVNQVSNFRLLLTD